MARKIVRLYSCGHEVTDAVLVRRGGWQYIKCHVCRRAQWQADRDADAQVVALPRCTYVIRSTSDDQERYPDCVCNAYVVDGRCAFGHQS